MAPEGIHDGTRGNAPLQCWELSLATLSDPTWRHCSGTTSAVGPSVTWYEGHSARDVLLPALFSPKQMQMSPGCPGLPGSFPPHVTSILRTRHGLLHTIPLERYGRSPAIAPPPRGGRSSGPWGLTGRHRSGVLPSPSPFPRPHPQTVLILLFGLLLP